ncbi:amidoligase family protein [Fluviibacterium sp. DFM31]|uniref:Amidoligase family protein n=1 Tax=Meridianimarinicoccus marinus TaxID=3231483 RepID=A0ABV3LB94_9RHOB
MTSPDTQRRIGVEVEFGGLSEARAAELILDQCGGEVTGRTEHVIELSTDRLGKMTVELDTVWKHEIAAAGDAAGAIARTLVPVELVTAPIREAQIPVLDDVLVTLARHGAEGSRDSLLAAYGVHFNPETGFDASVVRMARTYAALEPWLRAASHLDATRRLLPFINPWPGSLVQALLAPEAADLTPDELPGLYLSHTTSRNHGLDLLPLLRHHDADTVTAALGTSEGSARPTYHFRLPECRLSEPGWSLDHEWTKWRLVEAVAADPELLAALIDAVRGAKDPVNAAETVIAPLLNRETFACLAR